MIASEAELTERRELGERLGALPGRLAEVARRAPDRDPAEEAWPTRTIVLHLLLVEEVVWQARLREMAETANPVWVWTEPELGDRRAAWSLGELLGAFARRRRETVDLLAALDDEGWRRAGTHAVFGVLDVAGLVRQAIAHDAEHIAELERRSAP